MNEKIYKFKRIQKPLMPQSNKSIKLEEMMRKKNKLNIKWIFFIKKHTHTHTPKDAKIVKINRFSNCMDIYKRQNKLQDKTTKEKKNTIWIDLCNKIYTMIVIWMRIKWTKTKCIWMGFWKQVKLTHKIKMIRWKRGERRKNKTKTKN